MTENDIEAQALTLSKRNEQAVLAADVLQEIAEDEAVPPELRKEALRLRIGAAELARALWADRQRVRALGASCQDAASFGPTRPPPPPPPPDAVAEPSPIGPHGCIRALCERCIKAAIRNVEEPDE